MKPRIDVFIFEKYFKLFLKLVETKSKTKFVSFPSNRYTEENEGYKDEIYERARNNLQFWNWKEEDIGKGKIISKIIQAIKLENNKNNLVDWRLISKFEDKTKDEKKIYEYEKAFFDFFHDLETDQKTFDIFVEYFGEKYPLIAYLFFIKDKARYMPISPTNFDVAFNKLGVQGFRSSHRCSWDNYKQYNGLLNEVKELLLSKGIRDVSMLNSHSFVWIISYIEDEIKTMGVSIEEERRVISKYKELGSKDREAIIKARNGQGFFRHILVDFWGECSVTECNKINVLVASHIKPWKDCENEEAIDVNNGLLLTPNIDKLFDRGLVSFLDTGEIMISSQLNDKNLIALGITKDMKISRVEKDHFKYLDYHRKNIFIQ